MIGDVADLAILTCDYSSDCSAAFVHCDLLNIYLGDFSEIHDCHHRDYSIRFYERMNRVDADDLPIVNICRVPAILTKNLAWNGYCVLCRNTRSLAAIDEVDEILDLNENPVDCVESSVVCSAETSVDSDENLSVVYNEKILVLAGNHLDPDAEIAVAAAVEVVPNASSVYLA